jgi:Flp pilus assembly protein TadD
MRRVERTLWAGEERRHAVPDLLELARISDEGTDTWRFALRTLACILAESDAWRASLLARRLLTWAPQDHEAWGALGLAQSIVGNTRYAARCYERAISFGGPCLPYLHNLGHLYDVCLDRLSDALPMLEAAHVASTSSRQASLRAEIAASFAHALARAGENARALDVLRKALPRGRTRAQAELLAWIEERAAGSSSRGAKADGESKPKM